MSLTMALENRVQIVSYPGDGFSEALETHFEGERVCCIALNVLKGYREDYLADESPSEEEKKRIDRFIADAEAHWERRDCPADWYILMFRRQDSGGIDGIGFADPLHHLPSPGWDFFERQIAPCIESSDPIVELSLASLREAVEFYEEENETGADDMAMTAQFLEAAETHWQAKGLDSERILALWADLPVA